MENSLERILNLAGKLDPGFEQRVDGWQRYGLPSSSIPGGSRSSEIPMPVNQHGLIPDELDRSIRKDRRARSRALENAIVALLFVDGIEQKYRALEHDKASQLAAEELSPKAVNCGNENCQRPVERTPADRLRAGRCHACYEWFQSHGSERPKERCEAWIEREAARLTKRGMSR